MILKKNNDIDDELALKSEKKSSQRSKEKKLDFNFFKVPLIIIGILLACLLIIFLIVKLSNKQVVYEDRLYYINLVGDSNITLYLGEEYVEPGYKGTDDKGKDLTPDVAIENNIDVNSIGNYKVTIHWEILLKKEMSK